MQGKLETISEGLLEERGLVGLKGIIKFREDTAHRRSQMSRKRICTRYPPQAPYYNGDIGKESG